MALLVPMVVVMALLVPMVVLLHQFLRKMQEVLVREGKGNSLCEPQQSRLAIGILATSELREHLVRGPDDRKVVAAVAVTACLRDRVPDTDLLAQGPAVKFLVDRHRHEAGALAQVEDRIEHERHRRALLGSDDRLVAGIALLVTPVRLGHDQPDRGDQACANRDRKRRQGRRQQALPQITHADRNQVHDALLNSCKSTVRCICSALCGSCVTITTVRPPSRDISSSNSSTSRPVCRS